MRGYQQRLEKLFNYRRQQHKLGYHEETLAAVEATLRIYEENLGWRQKMHDEGERRSALERARRQARFIKTSAQRRLQLELEP